MKKLCIAALFALGLHSASQAGTGLKELPGIRGDGPVTVFYPSSATDHPVQRGPFSMALAPQGIPVQGNGRLVVISHGSGGNPWVHSDLARALVSAGFVVAFPEHAGDNARNPSTPGPESWKQRPAEVSRAIDAVAQDASLAPLLQLDKVGMYGMSAGGHTALSLAGGRWSPALFKQHCEAHIAEDFSTCVGLITQLKGNFLDGIKKAVALGVIRQRFDDASWQVHEDPRIRAIVAGVPAAADFDFPSLSSPRVPLGLVTAGQDRWLVPRFHSGKVLQVCQTCTVVADLPTAGHGALLSPPPPAQVLDSLATELLGDPPGFDRSLMPQVDARIVAFLAQHLEPLRPTH
ncbi:putative dienelactone hydrolase [Acidovorax sp. 69]|uniref:alpha/beta hydrolase family protein n=1 Tax=Acidovorax sp. 69 TaxID=2035202 RepID=UPI000C2342D2|nr:dienelactone hydrolase [Acidovorax sp. 69]PJI98550.1 putative dienelactone hydrolase [Acidovorax sp. 69]